jgi:hypothetical protein
LRIFALNDGFVLQALDGLTQEELWKAPTDRNNALHDSYHVGQLAYVRKGLGYPGLAG